MEHRIAGGIATGLRKRFGYIMGSPIERWSVIEIGNTAPSLIVLHPKRKPRVYREGCQGIYTELEIDGGFT